MSHDAGKVLIDQLEKTGKGAILVTWVSSSPDGSFKKGDQLRVQASDSLDNKATAQKLLAVAIQLNQHLGLLKDDFLDDYLTTDL